MFSLFRNLFASLGYGLLFFILPFSLTAQNFRHGQVSKSNGLSHNAIKTIYQDEQGFLWFGTKKGLNRYNGHNFKTFRARSEDSTSLSDEDIYCIYEGEKNILWIGTYAGGLNAYHRTTGKFKHYMYRPDDTQSLNSNDVRCVKSGPYGKLWVGTWGGGVNIFDKEAHTFDHFVKSTTGLSSNNIKCFLKGRNGRMWIGTWGGGLNMFDPDKDSFQSFGDTSEPSPTNITAIAHDQMNPQWLWVASWGEGLLRFHRSKHIFEKVDAGLPSDLLLSLKQDKEGRLWVGTEENGLFKIDIRQNASGNLQVVGKSRIKLGEAKHIKTIMRDKASTFWIGTVSHGGYALHPPRAHFQYEKKEKGGLNNNQVMAIAELSPDRLLIGTYGGGLNFWDRTENTYRYYTTQDGLSSNNLWTFHLDKKGRVWLGTWGGGLNRLDLQSNRVKQFDISDDGSGTNSSDIRCIFQDSKGDIWLGSWGGGVNRYNQTTQTFTYYTSDPKDTNTISSDNVWSITEDNQGRLWIGTWGGGLNVYDPEQDRFNSFTHQPGDSSSLSDNYIYCLHYQPSKDVIWVGTSNGLNQFNMETKETQQFFKKDGLPSNIIVSIEEGSHGYLWISTSKGITRLNQSLLKKKIDNPEISIFKNYTPSDGLQAYEFNQNASYIDKQEGKIYFGGVNGFNYFQPQNVLGNTRVPPIVITALKKYGERVQLDTPITQKDHLTLSYQDNFFSIEFAALNYILPDQNQYAYKLEGFDKKWNYGGNLNIASYTNIPGGQYTLKIKGANNDGVWNEKGTSLRITVVPPFWKTNTFYILCALFILVSFYTIYRLRLRSLRKSKQTLEKQVQERTAHIRKQKNKIERINEDITNSINYAKRIQDALLSEEEKNVTNLPSHFVLFKPLSIVSGDFYWSVLKGEEWYVAVADCTGHGVPGALLTMLGTAFLNEITADEEDVEPGPLLDRLRKRFVQELKKKNIENEDFQMRDGMDISLLRVNLDTLEARWSGANNPLYLIRSDDNGNINVNYKRHMKRNGYNLYELSAHHQHIGYVQAPESFPTYQLQLKKHDSLYMFSDGFPDQFGGPRGKKFKRKRFKRTLIDIQDKDMEGQKEALDNIIEDWMAQHEEEQIDDICVLGGHIT